MSEPKSGNCSRLADVMGISHELANAGFQQASLGCYWSYFYGYLGEPQYFLWSQKPG